MANMTEVAPIDAMHSIEACKTLCLRLVGQAGLRAVGECFYAFGEGAGVTGVVILAESHVAIHTWPESNYVTLDVFVCNAYQDNRQAALQLFEAMIAEFQPQSVKRYQTVRD